MGATVSLAQATLPVDPGGQVALEVTLRNTGTVVDQFTVEVLGDAAAWATVEPPLVSLFPAAQGTAQVTFRPPRAFSTPSGTVRFGVMARSKEDPTGSAVEEGTLEVGGFLAPSTELLPRTSHGSRSARHELAIDNRGNLPMAAAIEGVDPDRLLRFDIDPPTVNVDPGVAGFAKVAVKPVRSFWRGPAKTRPFQLAVRTGGAESPPLLVDGSFLQESILPWWFLRAVLVAGALLIAAILFWLFVLQPQIRSTAADTLKDFGFTPRPGSSAAGGGGGGGGGGASPGPSGVVTVTPGPGERNEIDGRLDPTLELTASGGTLSITDLVFSNPTGASGDLMLQRVSPTATTTLFALRLENFRDLDFHFVTPITVRDGEKLLLVATCTPGTGPTTPACEPAVFYSGYLQGP